MIPGDRLHPHSAGMIRIKSELRPIRPGERKFSLSKKRLVLVRENRKRPSRQGRVEKTTWIFTLRPRFQGIEIAAVDLNKAKWDVSQVREYSGVFAFPISVHRGKRHFPNHPSRRKSWGEWGENAKSTQTELSQRVDRQPRRKRECFDQGGKEGSERTASAGPISDLGVGPLCRRAASQRGENP